MLSRYGDPAFTSASGNNQGRLMTATEPTSQTQGNSALDRPQPVRMGGADGGQRDCGCEENIASIHGGLLVHSRRAAPVFAVAADMDSAHHQSNRSDQ